MELKNVTDDAIDSGMEVDIVDTEKFIFDKANDEKILLGLFFIALSLSWLATKLNRRKGSQTGLSEYPQTAVQERAQAAVRAGSHESS